MQCNAMRCSAVQCGAVQSSDGTEQQAANCVTQVSSRRLKDGQNWQVGEWSTQCLEQMVRQVSQDAPRPCFYLRFG